MINAFFNQKRGVGKTTLALHLAGEWSREGKRVALIDADREIAALAGWLDRAWPDDGGAAP
jgi:chromosome partitioning protein